SLFEFSGLLCLDTNSARVVITPHFDFGSRKFLWLRHTILLLLFSGSAERRQLQIKLTQIVLPVFAVAIDRREEGVGRRSSQLRRKVLALKLLKENMNNVQVSVTKVQSGTLISVKVEQRSWIGFTLSVQIIRARSSRRNRRHKRVHRLD